MKDFLWVEKYRPNSISGCILPNELKNTFTEIVKDKDIPNLILSGGPGVGKTTVAKAMIEEIGATYMMVNGSEESGIDTLRTKIKNFASTVSLEGGRKYIILDEADYLVMQDPYTGEQTDLALGHIWDEDSHIKHVEMFNSLLTYWKLVKNYDSSTL